MRISDAFPSNWLKATDLQGRTVMVKIDRVASEEVGDGHKPVLYFAGKEKGLVLNKTNANEIAFVYGDETDAWIGKTIELFSMRVQYQGRMVDGLRVRVPAQRASTNGGSRPQHHNPPPPTAQDMNDPILDDEQIPF